MERVKWTEKIKNSIILERVGEGRKEKCEEYRKENEWREGLMNRK